MTTPRQCKDIDTATVLRFLAQHQGRWSTLTGLWIRCKLEGMWIHEHKGRRYVCWKVDGKQQRQLEHRWVWEQAHGPIPEGHHIHHKDENPLNNRLDNLECLPAAQHWDLHNRAREQHQQINGVEHRKCQRCSTFKPLTNFSVRRAGTYHGYCKICVKQYLADWRAKNREHWNTYHREYRAKSGS